MTAIILSGVGGSTNWLPLIFPLVALIVVAKGIDMLVHYVKNRRLHHGHSIVDPNANYEDVVNHETDNGKTV
jgi:hypothetical protein